MKDFYNYLIRAKDIAHLSPDAQAREFGIAPNTLKKIERGEPVTMNIFKRLCHAIGKTTKEVADMYPEAFGHGKKRHATLADTVKDVLDGSIKPLVAAQDKTISALTTLAEAIKGLAMRRVEFDDSDEADLE